jgi:hypothetical protein
VSCAARLFLLLVLNASRLAENSNKLKEELIAKGVTFKGQV